MAAPELEVGGPANTQAPPSSDPSVWSELQVDLAPVLLT